MHYILENETKKIIPVDQLQVAPDEIFDDFKIDLSELKGEVRAKEMMSKGIGRDQAITREIQEAVAWFLESQG